MSVSVGMATTKLLRPGLPKEVQSLNHYERACYHACRLARRYRGGLDLAERYLERVEKGYGGFGVEAIRRDGLEVTAEYLNQGDTYTLTVLDCSEDGLIVSTWGDWLETAESEHYEETGEQGCCYCGEMAECKEHHGSNWHGWACQDCRENH